MSRTTRRSPRVAFPGMADTDTAAVRELLRDSFTRLIEHVEELTDGLTDELAFFRPTAGRQQHRLADLAQRPRAGCAALRHRGHRAGRGSATAGSTASASTSRAIDTGYGHDPDEVGKVRASADLLAGYYHAVHKVTLEYIASVTPDELSRIVDTPLDIRRSPRARGWSASSTTAPSTWAKPPTCGASPADPRSAPPVAADRGGRDVAARDGRCGKGSTPVDDWFQRYWDSPARWLLFFTEPAVLRRVVVLAVLVGRACIDGGGDWRWRRSLCAARRDRARADCSSPCSAVRRAVAWPIRAATSTTLVVVVGLVVLATGVRAGGRCSAAVAVVLLGMVGAGITYHYFTDTVGGLLLGTAIVCVAALTSGRAPRRT